MSEMKINCIPSNFDSIYQKREHLCLGISPFNSYFSEAKLCELAAFGKAEFKMFHFFIPDVPSVYTLEALGYPAEKAEWKARRQCQYLSNKAHKALRSIGISEIDCEKHILNWERVNQSKTFQTLHAHLKQEFESSNEFRLACIDASRWVLEKRVEDVSQLSPTALELATKYLLAELPLFLDTPGILADLPGPRIQASLFGYHQCIPFFENLFNNVFSVKVATRQGFLWMKNKAPEFSERLQPSENQAPM